MKKRIISISLLIISLFTTRCLTAQEIEARSENAAMSDSLIALYKNTLGKSERLYTGTEYIGYVTRPKGHPFFLVDQLELASIAFDGAVYKDSVLYDLVNDAIILRDPNSGYNIVAIRNKIGWFTLLGHKFVWLDAYSNGAVQLEAGFYEQPYNGTLQVFLRHKKQINSHTVQSDLQSEYVQYDSYFIRKGAQYFRVTNTKSLLEVFGDHKNEVRKYLHEQDLEFRKDPANTIRVAATYFDQIKK